MSRIKVGVIGAGLWGSNHARVFQSLPQTELVAVCDLDADRAAGMASEYGAATSMTDYRELLEKPEISAISIATPDFCHASVIVDALKAGKHVLTEKPMAITEEDISRISGAAATAPGKLMVDFHNRVNPVFTTARAAISAGEIGAPVHLSARLSNTTYVPLEMLSWSSRSSALWFLGSHVVDILRFLLDDDVKRVQAVRRDGVLKRSGIDTADVHLAILEFAGGAVATLENSWILPPDNPMIFDFKVEVVGESGQLQLDPSHNGAFRQTSGKGLDYRDLFGIAPTAGGRIGGFVLEAIARFVDAIIDDQPPLASLEDGIAATRTLMAIEQAASSGKAVEL